MDENKKNLELHNIVGGSEMKLFEGKALKFSKDIDDPSGIAIDIVNATDKLNQFEKIKLSRKIKTICDIFPYKKIIMED